MQWKSEVAYLENGITCRRFVQNKHFVVFLLLNNEKCILFVVFQLNKFRIKISLNPNDYRHALDNTCAYVVKSYGNERRPLTQVIRT